MPIKIDATRGSTVVTCTLCPSYAEGALDRSSGLRLGAAHETRAHPDNKGDAAERAKRITTRRTAGA